MHRPQNSHHLAVLRARCQSPIPARRSMRIILIQRPLLQSLRSFAAIKIAHRGSQRAQCWSPKSPSTLGRLGSVLWSFVLGSLSPSRRFHTPGTTFRVLRAFRGSPSTTTCPLRQVTRTIGIFGSPPLPGTSELPPCLAHSPFSPFTTNHALSLPSPPPLC